MARAHPVAAARQLIISGLFLTSQKASRFAAPDRLIFSSSTWNEPALVCVTSCRQIFE